MEFLEESQKHDLEQAWWVGRLFHVDPKKYPKMPALLWDSDADRQTPEQMARAVLAAFDPAGHFQKKHGIKLN